MWELRLRADTRLRNQRHSLWSMDAGLSTQMEKVGCHSKTAMKVVSSGLSTEYDQQAAVEMLGEM